MPCLLFNPSSLLCLDYTLEVFEQTCLPLINDTTSHVQATALLTNLWTASNVAKKLLWQAQVDMDELDMANALQQQAEAVAVRILKEKEDLCKEEQKKNRSKFLSIPDWPVPQRVLVITAQSATRRIDKGKCVITPTKDWKVYSQPTPLLIAMPSLCFTAWMDLLPWFPPLPPENPKGLLTIVILSGKISALLPYAW